MDSQYASIGRKTLEKMRQKKFDARLGKIDNTSLLFQLKEMEKTNRDLDEENQQLSSKLQSKETENEILKTKLNDVSLQLRRFLNRIKEAEEEQLKAEQDTAAMRSELYGMKQKALNDHHVAIMVRDEKFRDMGDEIERLEICRQKLLAEVDSQSAEIERLFEDNSDLRAAYEKVLAILEARDDGETVSGSPPPEKVAGALEEAASPPRRWRLWL